MSSDTPKSKFQLALERAYQAADKSLGGWLPNGGTGNPLSNAARPIIKNIPIIDESVKTGEEAREIQQFQNRAEKTTTNYHQQIKDALPKDRSRLKEQYERELEEEGIIPQIDLFGGNTKQVKFCPINRDSYKLAKQSANNYRVRTQDTPDNAMNGCVETVQRNFEGAGLDRVKGSESFFREYAGNTIELEKGLIETGRGHLIDTKLAGPGDIVFKLNGVGESFHSGIITDRKDENGNYLVNSNSGSHGSMSWVFPVDKPSRFRVVRLGRDPNRVQIGIKN